MANTKAAAPLPEGYETLTNLIKEHTYIDPRDVKKEINRPHSNLHKHARQRTREEQPAGVLGYIIEKKAFEHYAAPIKKFKDQEKARKTAEREAAKAAKEAAAAATAKE